MRIGINLAILSSRLAGVGTYALMLVQALGRVDRESEFVLFGVPPSLDGLPRGENFRALAAAGVQGWRRIAWEQCVLPGLVRRAGLDLLHCPDFSRPVFGPPPIVNTIHDLSYFARQRFFSLPRLAYKRAMARHAIGRSAALVVDSDFTRQEVRRRFRVDEGRVFVVHLGVELLADAPRRAADPPYLLFVGTLEERKNLVTLVEAFSRLRECGWPYHRLVLVGQRGWGWTKIQGAIRSSRARNGIDVRGYVGRDELVRLYRAADLFVYPSVYEGFGLPVLEAMACGTPVVCSRAASLPEVAGEAAEYFDPSNAQDLVAAIERVLASDELRATLGRKGLEQARKFSWDECARRHAEVYRAVLHL